MTEQRHFDWIRGLASAIGAWDNRQVALFDRMHRERDNLWAALDSCARQPAGVAAASELAQDLLPYWVSRGPFGDVRRVLTSLAELAPEDSIARGRLLWVAAVMASSMNDYDACAALSEERATALTKERRESWCRGYQLDYLARGCWLDGDRERAEALSHEAIACKHAVDDRVGLTMTLETLASMAADRGTYERAAVLLGSAQRVCDESSLTLIELHRQQHERSVSLIIQGIGHRAFDAAYARGRAMTIDEGVAFAVEDKPAQKLAPPAKSASDTELTPRQLEIARLIAADLTNRQIADRLFLSERTVETHITNILNKLGLNSRIQLGRWMAELPDATRP